MTRPVRALLAILCAVAAVALAACGGSEETSDTTTTAADPSQTSPQTVEIAGFKIDLLEPQDASEYVADLGLGTPNGARITKDGEEVMVVVGGQLPAGTEANDETVKATLVKIVGGGTAEQVSIGGQPGWGVSHEGKAAIGAADPSGQLQIGIGSDLQQMLADLEQISNANVPSTDTEVPAPEAPATPPG